MIDRDGKQCESCGEGTYEIADLNDEIHGERHCNKCGHFVYRYERTPEELAHRAPQTPSKPLIIVSYTQSINYDYLFPNS